MNGLQWSIYVSQLQRIQDEAVTERKNLREYMWTTFGMLNFAMG